VAPGSTVPKIKLTDRKLQSLKPARAGDRYELLDSLVPGFGVRVTDKGQRTFILKTRYPGSRHPTRRALGEYGVLTLEQAREKAREWLKLIRQGKDPKAEIERLRAAEQRKRANSFRAVAEDFIKDKLSSERKGAEVERDIRREFLPAWAGRPIADITALDVRTIVKAAKAAPPTRRITF
jgi:hypothetical protein